MIFFIMYTFTSKQDYTVTVKLSIYTLLPLYPNFFSLNQKENRQWGYTLFHNVIYVKDFPKYRLTELVRFCGLGLRTLVSTEASVQRVEKGRYPAWLGDIHFSFTFTVANPINLETCGCHTFQISLNCTETRDQFAWCRRRTVVYGNGWVIFVIIPIHCHVSFSILSEILN